MKIAIVARKETEDVTALLARAHERGILCEHVVVDSPDTYIDADVVYWRSSVITSQYKRTVGRACVMKENAKHAVLVNGAIVDNPLTTKKSYQQVHIKTQNIGIEGISTFLAADTKMLLGYIDRGELSYPIIAKPDSGWQGNGILLLKAEEDIGGLEDIHTYVFQNFIPNDGDYRVFVIGGVAVDVVKRSASVDSTKQYLNNISQGGTMQKVLDKSKREKLLQAGERIAGAFGLTISGVDLIEDSETGKVHFMEINSVPQWTMFKEALCVNVTDQILDTLVALGQRCLGVPSVAAIRDAYIKKAPLLGTGKQFHFLSRMYLWTGNDMYKHALDSMADLHIKDEDFLVHKAEQVVHATYSPLVGGRQYRKKYHAQYHKLYAYNAIFFKLLFHESIFGRKPSRVIDAIDKTDIESLRAELLEDTEALFTLSTSAVNFLYHYEYFYGTSVDTQYLLQVVDAVSLNDQSNDLHARLYFLTHMIIGASHFYKEKLLTHNSLLDEVFSRLEKLVVEHYPNLSLDMKCEFAVCARLLGKHSAILGSVEREVLSSFSEHGNFIIDTYNTHRERNHHHGMRISEHRNVLAIMAFDKE